MFYAKYRRVKRSNILLTIRVQKIYGLRQRRGGGSRKKQQGEGFKTKIRSVIRKSGKVVKWIYHLGKKVAVSKVGKVPVHEGIK